MKCLIVAAGQGVRLREKGALKPLIRLKGIFLIEHVIERASSAGASEFLVVSGYRGEELRRELDRFAQRRSIRVTHVVNDDWRRGNGVSLLSARRHLDESFLLTMSDHLIDPRIFRALISTEIEPATVTLAVDSNIDNPLNDPDDVTRVRCSDGRIQQIGKLIAGYNAIDTGAFPMHPGHLQGPGTKPSARRRHHLRSDERAGSKRPGAGPRRGRRPLD